MSVDISVSITEDVVDIIATPTVNIVNVTNSASIDPGLYDLSEFTNTSVNPFVRTSGLSSYVPTTRTISTTAPLSGGGDLSANRTLSIATANTTTTGALSSTDWNTFNGKQNALGFTPVPTSRTLTINGTTQDLSADRTFTISTGITIGTTAITSGTVGRVLFEGTGNVVSESANLFWDNTNGRLGIGTSSPAQDISVIKSSVANGAVGIGTRNNTATGEAYLSIYNDLGEYGALEIFGSTFASSSLLRKATFTSSGNNGFGIVLYNNTSTANFTISTGITQTERFRLFGATGNVGINTTTDAGYKLDVNGTARLNTLTIGLGGGQQATNTALGYQALNANTTAISNVAVGYQALFATTTGQENVAVGETALRNSNNGANVAVGRRAMLNNTGAQNTVIGHRAVEGTGNGSSNSVLGQQALQSLTTGSNNSILGRNALFAHTTGDSNSVLGADTVSGNFSGSVILGRTATATANNQFVVGSTGTNAGSVTTEVNASTQVWNVIINGVARKILLA